MSNEVKEVSEFVTGRLVRYKHIPKRVFGVTNPNHLLYDGKQENAIDKFHVLTDTSGRFKLNVSDEDKTKICKGLGLSEEDLNTHNPKNEYLRSFDIDVPKIGLILDLDKPFDMLVDGVLSAYDNIMAPGAKAVKNKASYKYVRLVEDEEINISLEAADNKKKAYKLLGSLETSREKMIMYVVNSGGRLVPTIDNKSLRKIVNDAADKNPLKFINLMSDPLFVEKGLIRMGAIVGVVKVVSSLYYFSDLPLAHKGESATLETAAVFLKDVAQAEIRLAISNGIVDGFKRTK